MKLLTGAIGPLQPKSGRLTTILLIVTSAVFATTSGYDSAMMSGLNIIPNYTEFLKLTTETKALNTAANFIGWGIASLTMGPVVDYVGRKNAFLISICIKVISIALVTSAQNVGMFLSGRIILGVGKGLSGIAGSTWLAETLPPKIRGLGLSIIFSVYYVGALIAAGVTYGSARIEGEWSWRLPCLLQSLFAIVCVVCLFCTPESPRWLLYHDQGDAALAVLASIASDGDRSHPDVLAAHHEITTTRAIELSEGTKVTYSALFKSPSSRRRVMLAVSVGVIAMGSGNNISSYYLGDMLNNAGVTNTTTQLQINIIINAWCLICALTGSFLMDRVGRKTLCLFALSGMVLTMYILGGLTKEFSSGGKQAGIYGTVAAIFLFMGSYSVGITPITQLYPPEVLSYAIRSNGMALWAGTIAIFAITTTFSFPIALKAISWKLYLIIASWDLLEAVFVYFFWVETKGLSLEQINVLFGETAEGIMPRKSDEMPAIIAGEDAKEVASIAVEHK